MVTGEPVITDRRAMVKSIAKSQAVQRFRRASVLPAFSPPRTSKNMEDSMYARESRLGILLVFFAALASMAVAQTSQPSTPPSCAAPEFRQLDFWVGDWDLTWPGSRTNEIQHGRNTIRKMLDDCVIQEQFDGGADVPLRGISVSMYNARLQKWQQTWVDNQGAYLDFVGEFRDGQMTLSRHGRNQKGDAVEQRMVFKGIQRDSFDWNWEQSTDGGKSWTVIWPIHYVRHKP
jgi:hypothetical protein